MLSREKVAMNREEVDHGSQGKSQEVEIEKEGQEGCGEEEDGRETLRAEEKIRSKEKEGCTEESSGKKEIRAEEAGTAETRSKTGRTKARSETRGAKTRTCARRSTSSGFAKPDHLSPVQPAGGRRQSG
ncbi:MAG: hypothetical protein WDO17_08285 [Alphaproteobacteria bacterium]